jgi:chitinase
MHFLPAIAARSWPGLAAVCLCIGSCGVSRAELWTTGYYPGYRQAAMPPSLIDFSALSHIIHFSLAPQADGTVTFANSLTPAYATALVTQAHAANRKALICVAGSGSGGFMGAASTTNRATFIANLLSVMTTYGYDGVDVDWEPLNTSEAQTYTNFINDLSTALRAFAPPRLLTVATADEPSWFASLQGRLDQINLMTYGLSGAWAGWVTWFNAPLYDGGYRFPSTGGLVPSTEGMVNKFLAAGVAPGKLAIGVAFYGKKWTGGTGTSTGGASLPRQSWTTAPTVSSLSFSTIMSSYYQESLYHWDDAAQSAYLSIDNTGSANDSFISYDNERTCQGKVSYARNRGLGGVMIWELGQGYRSSEPPGLRDPLLQAIKQSRLAVPNFTSIRRSGTDILLAFNTMPLALYRVEWAAARPVGAWSTLTNNVTGTGNVIEVVDRGATSVQSARFYRVRTPP